MTSHAKNRFLNSAKEFVEDLDIFNPYELHREEIYLGFPLGMCSTRLSYSDDRLRIKNLSYVRKVNNGIQHNNSGLKSSELVFKFHLDSGVSFDSGSWSSIVNSFSSKLELELEPPTVMDDVLKWERSGGTGTLKYSDSDIIDEDIEPKEAVIKSMDILLYKRLPEYGESTDNPRDKKYSGNRTEEQLISVLPCRIFEAIWTAEKESNGML